MTDEPTSGVEAQAVALELMNMRQNNGTKRDDLLYEAATFLKREGYLVPAALATPAASPASGVEAALTTLCNAVMADISEAKRRLDADIPKDAPVHPVSAFLTGTALHIGKARAALATPAASPATSDYCATEGCVHQRHGCPTWPEGTNPFAASPSPAPAAVEELVARLRHFASHHANPRPETCAVLREAATALSTLAADKARIEAEWGAEIRTATRYAIDIGELKGHLAATKRAAAFTAPGSRS